MYFMKLCVSRCFIKGFIPSSIMIAPYADEEISLSAVCTWRSSNKIETLKFSFSGSDEKDSCEHPSHAICIKKLAIESAVDDEDAPRSAAAEPYRNQQL
mmetsp:Transcript_19071/g.40135  ORF Transcript_19071/g.40135 Transcript_19071/m.40135 type:complete len:99 (+) Transcript_19071:1415-1711(+)